MKREVSMPNYAAINKRRTRHYAKHKECEICGHKKQVYVFVKYTDGPTRCSCKRHLRRIK